MESNFSVNRVPALDGVRGLAILIVIIAHLGLLQGGNFGVDLFFVLSGFLITSILLQEQRRNGVISISKFYLRRALRLLPALFVFVLSVLLYTFICQPFPKFLLAVSDAWRIALYCFNWQITLEYGHHIMGYVHHEMFPHLWSLSVEEQFYLIWPCLLLLLLKKSRSFVLYFLLAGMAAEGIARFISSDGGPSYWIYFSTLMHSDGLMYGALVAWILHWGYMPKGLSRTTLSWVGAISLVVLLLVSIPNPLNTGAAYRGLFSFVNLLCALLIASAIWCPQSPLRWFLESKPMTWIGKVSYGLYIWHYPVHVFIGGLAFFNKFWEPVIIIGLTLIITSISYYKLELPFLKLKDRIGHAKKPQPSIDSTEMEPVNISV